MDGELVEPRLLFLSQTSTISNYTFLNTYPYTHKYMKLLPLIKGVSLSSSWRSIEKSTNGWQCREQLTVVILHQLIHLQYHSHTKGIRETVEEGGRKIIEVRRRGHLLWDWALCLWREITLESTTNGRLNKTWTMTTPEAILTWMGKYYKTPPKMKSYGQFMATERGRTGLLPYRLSCPKWSVLNTNGEH